MAVHASHAALPYPIKNARFSFLIPYLDADGDPTDPTTPDTEISGDNGAFADCAEEASTASGSNGMALMTLSGAEMNYSTVALAAKVASGPKATLMTLYPRALATVGSGTLSTGSAGGGTLGTLLAYDVTGCFIQTTGGTGGGGTGGANNQVRTIVTYNTSTGAFTVAPNWETTPDNTTTYNVLLPVGVTLGMLRALNPATPGRTLVVDSAGLADATAVKVGPTGSGTAQTARDLGASVLLSPGTGTGQVSLSSGAVTVGTNNDKTGYGLSSAAVQAIWDALTSALTTVGSIGKLLVDRIDAAISSRSSHDAAAVVTALGTGSTLTAVPDTSGTTTLLSRLSAVRAGYLDNLSAGAVATASDLATAQTDLDTLTGADGVTLATSQPNYAPATASALTTVDTVVDAIRVVTDALGATAAARLALSAGTMVPGTVDTATNSHTPTTTEFQADDITEATDDHYNGRIVIFTSGALTGQATDITDYTNVGGIAQFTVTAMTEAPANNDTFIIV